MKRGGRSGRLGKLRIWIRPCGTRRGKASRVLLAIHMDTGSGAENAFRDVTRLDENTLCGPGVCDAKGGMLVMLFALMALQAVAPCGEDSVEGAAESR